MLQLKLYLLVVVSLSSIVTFPFLPMKGGGGEHTAVRYDLTVHLQNTPNDSFPRGEEVKKRRPVELLVAERSRHRCEECVCVCVCVCVWQQQLWWWTLGEGSSSAWATATSHGSSSAAAAERWWSHYANDRSACTPLRLHAALAREPAPWWSGGCSRPRGDSEGERADAPRQTHITGFQVWNEPAGRNRVWTFEDHLFCTAETQL